MSTKITLYGVDSSPPLRSVLLTLKTLNLDFKWIEVNPTKGEHITPEFLKMNPQHTIPTLEDDGVYIWDSHAIMAYLVRKYGKDERLYPKDFHQRAVVDQRMHYESGVIFSTCIYQAARPIMLGKSDAEKLKDAIKQIHDIYDMLEIFMGDNQYIAGNNMTIADFSILPSVTSLVCVQKMQPGKHDKLIAWVERLKKLPYYEEANGKGSQKIGDMLKPNLAEIK